MRTWPASMEPLVNFSTDEETVKYLNLTARDKDLVEIVEKYNKIQGLWMDNQSEYNDHLELNLSSVQASLAGPKDLKIELI